jgi:hypothetical protein
MRAPAVHSWRWRRLAQQHEHNAATHAPHLQVQLAGIREAEAADKAADKAAAADARQAAKVARDAQRMAGWMAKHGVTPRPAVKKPRRKAAHPPLLDQQQPQLQGQPNGAGANANGGSAFDRELLGMLGGAGALAPGAAAAAGAGPSRQAQQAQPAAPSKPRGIVIKNVGNTDFKVAPKRELEDAAHEAAGTPPADAGAHMPAPPPPLRVHAAEQQPSRLQSQKQQQPEPPQLPPPQQQGRSQPPIRLDDFPSLDAATQGPGAVPVQGPAAADFLGEALNQLKIRECPGGAAPQGPLCVACLATPQQPGGGGCWGRHRSPVASTSAMCDACWHVCSPCPARAPCRAWGRPAHEHLPAAGGRALHPAEEGRPGAR